MSVPVAAFAAAYLRRRRQQPASVLRLAEQRGEAGAGVEARESSTSRSTRAATSAAVCKSPRSA